MLNYWEVKLNGWLVQRSVVYDCVALTHVIDFYSDSQFHSVPILPYSCGLALYENYTK